MAQEREIRAIGTPRESATSVRRSRARLPLVREVVGKSVVVRSAGDAACWWTCVDNDFRGRT
eukprot:3301844-Prymnesium_polylepis.1